MFFERGVPGGTAGVRPGGHFFAVFTVVFLARTHVYHRLLFRYFFALLTIVFLARTQV